MNLPFLFNFDKILILSSTIRVAAIKIDIKHFRMDFFKDHKSNQFERWLLEQFSNVRLLALFLLSIVYAVKYTVKKPPFDFISQKKRLIKLLIKFNIMYLYELCVVTKYSRCCPEKRRV